MTTATDAAVGPGATPSPEGVLTDVDQCRAHVTRALHSGAPSIVVQPILGLSPGRVVAYEALSRFTAMAASYSPDVWFAMAHRCGLGVMLEARAIDRALLVGADRPVGTVLSINVSPSVLGSRELHDALPFDLTGIQFEISEKQVVEDDDGFTVVLQALRDRGAQIAVDDIGEGYAGLQRVMQLRPDLLKLDRSLVTGLANEPVKAALVEAVVRYAARVGAEVCAEGVESLDDLDVLADLDVAQAQGWVIGIPTPTFEPTSEAAALTCQSSYRRTLTLGSRTPGQDATALERLLASLVECSSLDALAQSTAGIATHLECDLAQISYLDQDAQYLQGVAHRAWRPEGERYHLVDFPQTAACLHSLEIMTADRDDPAADSAEVEWMMAAGVATMIGIPVLAAGRVLGILECSRRDRTPWSRLQLRHARIIATVLGPVMANLHES